MESNKVTITDTLAAAPVRGHVVDFYDNSAQLSTRVADFAEPALRGKEAVVFVAMPEHLALFRETLIARGLPVQALERSGRLKCLEAEAAMNQFLIGGKVYWKPFESSIGTTISTLSRKYGKVRAYGEMVNVLWQKGLVNAAIELEGFWNQLSGLYPFCLFCAYSLDIFDPAHYPEAISAICGTHSHSFADSVDRSFETVVQKAINEIVEPRALIPLQAALASNEGFDDHLSPTLRALLWLNHEMPQIAEQVLSRARAYYQSCRP